MLKCPKICRMFNIFFVLFSDGEIISQIKMTNIALAEIKELLKLQVKTEQIKCQKRGKLKSQLD